MIGGRRIGRYEVVRELGRGGMGVVYEVRDPAADRRLALKLIAVDAGPEALARFRREAELMARVAHPGVVRVHALDVAAEGPFIVTDLVEGEALDAITRRGPLPAEAAARLVRALADAVEALHARDVLHRDLKPANVIVRPDGAPVLLDFGVARDLDSQDRLTRTGALVGTPTYMAPEQAEGLGPASLGATVDVHALGGILVEALTGQPPFDESGGAMAVVKRVMFDPPRWPSTCGVEVPAGVEAICRQAMAKTPAQRYPTAAALRADLDRFLQGERPRALERFAPPRPRARALGAAALAGVACVVGVVGLAALGPAEDERPGDVAATTSAAGSRSVRSRPPPPPPRATDAPRAPAPTPPSLPGARLLGHPDAARVVRGVFVDEDVVVTWGREDGSIRVWSLAGADVVLLRATVLDGGSVLDVVADGRALLARTRTAVLRLALESLEETCPPWTIPGEPPPSYGEEFRPLTLTAEGRLVVPTSNGVHVLETTTLAPVARLDAETGLLFASAAARGRWVVAGSGVAGRSEEEAPGPEQLGRGEVHRWDLAANQVTILREFPTAIVGAALGPGDPPPLALGMFSGSLALWGAGEDRPQYLRGPEAVDPRTQVREPVEVALAHSGHVLGVVFLSSGELLSVSGGYKPRDVRNEVRTWALDGTPTGWLCSLQRPPWGVALSPGGRRLLVGTRRVSDWSGAEVWELAELERALVRWRR